MIRKFYSNRNRPGWKYDARLKKYHSWGFDLWLADGRRKREPGFRSRTEAETAVARIRLLEKEIKYGFVAPIAAPTLREVCDKKLELTSNRREHTRASRVLSVLCAENPTVKKVTDIETAHLQRFVTRRKRDGLSPQSIDRELNIISAALHVGIFACRADCRLIVIM